MIVENTFYNNKPAPQPSYCYQIKVLGRLDERWATWFNCGQDCIENSATLQISLDNADSDRPVTTLTGEVQDQAHLRGILNKIWDLNLTLISVNRMEQR